VPAPNTLVLDACVAITFGNAARLDLITGLAAYRVAIGARARAEVARDPTAGQLRAAIESGSLSVAAIDLGVPAEAAALAELDRRPAFKGRGEAEVLALARSRGYAAGSDERAVLTAARSEFGAHLAFSSLDFLVFALRENRVEPGEADGLLARLDSGPQIRRYLAAHGRSLEDLV
jgi:hypothetical protein